MKNKFIFKLLLIILILNLASCSQKKATKQNFQFKLSALASGLSMNGGSFVNIVSTSSSSLLKLDIENSTSIPFGIYEFQTISFEGPSLYAGKKYCGRTQNVNLKDPEQSISMTITEANCLTQPFLALITKINDIFASNSILSITNISPNAGALAGGTAITITGSAFTSGASVTIGGTACGTVSVINPTTIYCINQSHSSGAADVVISTVNSLTTVSLGGFTYRPSPTVTNVSPNAGSLSGGTTVNISGTGFVSGAVVTIGGASCTLPIVLSSTSIQCTSPANTSGIKTIVVTNSDTQTGSLTSAFTYQAAPTVSASSPNQGLYTGGTNLIITGANFLSGATVSIGGSVCASIVVVDSVTINCTTTAHAVGLVDVAVTNTDTQTGVKTSEFSYQLPPVVVIINAFTPVNDPVSILSTGAQTFTVSATGKAPLAYEWKIDGTIISGETGASTSLAAASLTTGTHTLTCKVYDADSNQTKTFNIIKNAPPVLSNYSPANQYPKTNINTVLNLSANFSDANADSMSVIWKINNMIVGGSDPYGSVSTSTSLTTLTFTPNITVLGNNTIDLLINDGKETTSWHWWVNVNYLSDTCNNLGAGNACTVLGQPGLGSSIDPLINPEKVKIQPMFITPYGADSSYFFSDATTHTVWFYNRGATTKNILGQSIAAGNLQVVAGVGMSGLGTSGSAYDDFPLSSPRGLAWDNSTGRLFISDELSNRVLVLDSTGIMSIALGGGSNNSTGNQDNQVATSSFCSTPRGLAFNPTGSLLYVACSSQGVIKVVDTSGTIPAFTASILTGRASNGVTTSAFADGTNGINGTAQLHAPGQLKFDSDNNILYATTSSDCRVRAINLTGNTLTNYYFGAITLAGNSTTTVIGSGCSTFTMGAYSSVRYNGGWMGIELEKSGATLNGLYVTDYNTNRVTFINNTTSNISLGGASISSYQAGTIWGTPNGASGYAMPCSSANSSSCNLYNPASLWRDGNLLYLADYNNFRIRTLDVTVSNGTVEDNIGVGSAKGFAGNGGTSSENVKFNQPLNLYYDSSSNRIIISDFYNYRIRAFDLLTGKVDPFISMGAGDANVANVNPMMLGLRGPRAVVNFQDHFIFSDNQNSNCVLRAWNTTGSNQNILGILTSPNAVQTIAGNWSNGCGAWNPAAVIGTDATARLNNPQGVTTDGTNIYFANTGSHCIIKVDSSGNMTSLSGLCGTPGASNGSGINFGNATVRFNYPTAVVVDPRAPYTTAGNLFILDQVTTGSSKIRYLNQYATAVTIYGVTINPGEIKTIYAAADSHGADLASFDTMICFSSGGDFNYSSNSTSTTSNNNVVCFDRDDNTGTAFTRFGRNSASHLARGAQQFEQEDEGVSATSISLAGPAGLAFDGNGNLYISERDAHVIRLVKKWW